MPLVRLSNLEQFAAINLTADQGATGGPKLVPSCAEVTLFWGLTDGKVAHNVLAGRYAGAFAGTKAQADAINTAIKTGANWTAMAVFLATGTTLVAVSIRNIALADQAAIQSDGTPTPGTSTGTALPDENAVVVTLQTALTGPGNRGRAYIPGFASNAVGAGNVIAAGAVTAVQTWFTSTVRPALQAQGYTPCLALPARNAYTGITGTQHPARAARTQDITGSIVRDNHWDSQRRRGLR